jgi:hypothetical protein
LYIVRHIKVVIVPGEMHGSHLGYCCAQRGHKT